jgi:hypothetical protein
VKDQYFGDENDYLKYGLLRSLGMASGLGLGICWLRTADDRGRDGKFREYLNDPSRYRRHDPQLFDALSRLADPTTPRSVLYAEEWDLLPNATFHHRVLADSTSDRRTYFAEAWSRLASSPLLFLDPDNGIEVQSTAYGRSRSSKYVYWRELEEASQMGHSLIIYQHFPHEPREAFIERTASALCTRLSAALVASFRTPRVVFFLAARDEHAQQLESGIHLVKQRWAGHIRHSVHVVA